MPNHTFKTGDIVKTLPDLLTQKAGGKVKYVACGDARTSAGAICDKTFCIHPDNDFLWIVWPGTKTLTVYHYKELELDGSTQLEMPAEPTPIPVEVKSKINDAIKEFAGKKPITGEELDWELYTGKVKIGNGYSGNLVFRKGQRQGQ